MARNYRGINSLLVFALVGMLAGAILAAVGHRSLLNWSPPRFEASIDLFHPDGSGLSDSERDFVARTLIQPEFSPDLADRRGWDAEMAAEIAGNISVMATEAAGPETELRLSGTDPEALFSILNSVAEQVIEWHRDEQMRVLQSQLSELDVVLESAKRSQQNLKPAGKDDSRLPSSTHSAISAAIDLARQRRELELAGRYQLRRESPFDTLQRQQRLNVILAKEARLNKRIRERADIDATLFANEHAIVMISAELVAVQQAQTRLQQEFEAVQPLQIVPRAEINRVVPDTAPAELLVAVGGLMGALAGALVWSRRRSSPGKLSDLVGVGPARPPTLGVIGEYLMEYGEREVRPLAETDPEHLVLAGIHSLHTALYIMAHEQDHSGPIIVTEIGEPQHAAHVVANLATIASQSGERVLIIEAFTSPGMLSRIFANDDHAMASDGKELAEEDAIDARPDTRRIRFQFHEVPTHGFDEETLPVTSEFIGDFDRVLIHVANVTIVSDLLDGYGTGIGLLVCSRNTRLSASIKNQGTIRGIVLCDYRIDPSVYS